MDNSELTKLDIEISASGATEEELDRMTRQLFSELRQLDVEAVELAKGGIAPEGSKGDAVTLGSIAMEVLPVAIPSVIALVQAWVMRGQGRIVKFKSKEMEFEGSPEEFQRFLAVFEKGKKKK